MNDMPETSSPQEPMAAKKEGGMGSVSAIIIILALLVIGGGYYFYSSVDSLTTDTEMTPEMMAQDEVAKLEMLGDSDELASIEADVAATDLSPLDEAGAAFESEVGAQ